MILSRVEVRLGLASVPVPVPVGAVAVMRMELPCRFGIENPKKERKKKYEGSHLDPRPCCCCACKKRHSGPPAGAWVIREGRKKENGAWTKGVGREVGDD